MSDPYSMNYNPQGGRGKESIFTKHSSKEIGNWMLMSLKTEITLFDLTQSLYWQSILEVGLMIVCALLLITSGKFMIFLHSLHILRPYFAFLVIRGLPRLDSLYERLPEDLDGVSDTVQNLILQEFSKGSKRVSYYLIITAGAFALDLLGLIFDMAGLGGTSNSVAYYSIVAWVLLCFDCYFVFWYYTLNFHFPNDIWASLLSFAMGNLKETYDLAKEMIPKQSN